LSFQMSDKASMSLLGVRTTMSPVCPLTLTLASPLAAVTPLCAVKSVLVKGAGAASRARTPRRAVTL
jgi:hypothetical protein